MSGMSEYRTEDAADKATANIIDRKANDDKRERMLCYIRDTLIERAHGLRTGFESNSFLYCESLEGKADLKRVVAVEAAADIFTHLVAQWQDTKPEKRPEWLKTIVNQGMAAFIDGFR